LVAREPYRPLQLHYSVDALVESRPGLRRVRSAPHCRQLSQPHKLSFAEEEGVTRHVLRESLVAREPYRPLQLHYSVDALVESRPGLRRVRSAPHCRQLSQPHKLSFAEEEVRPELRPMGADYRLQHVCEEISRHIPPQHLLWGHES
uniref:DUF4524 domain-containing protein n=1 Tax=Heligmosomoides polygyrus TaxID=6339 RepID=A0A183GIY8_HELPZ